MRTSHETFGVVFGLALRRARSPTCCSTLTCLPLLLVVGAGDPLRAWPLLALLAPLVAPALTGAFTVLAGVGTEAVPTPDGRSCGPGARRSAPRSPSERSPPRRSCVLGVDVVALAPARGWVRSSCRSSWCSRSSWSPRRCSGSSASPSDRTARVREVLRAALYLGVRRWYLTLVSLAALAVLAGLVATRPAPGLGLAAAPLLYGVWANGRWTLRPVLVGAGADQGGAGRGHGRRPRGGRGMTDLPPRVRGQALGWAPWPAR